MRTGPHPLISCCTVTQAGRMPLLALSLGDFARQTHAPRELVIVHDGDEALHREILALAARHPGADIRVHREPAGQCLGALRNRAAALARGELVCQWDDDDRYHPQRLSLQLEALRAEDADVCFLTDQLHWFPASGELRWDDWDLQPYPMNFVQGTLLGRREHLPAYPELARGEDTAVTLALLRAGRRVARLRGAGWCYVYVFHGRNSFGLAHHAGISQANSMTGAQLAARESALRARLAEYAPPLGATVLQAPGYSIDISQSPAEGRGVR